jgi:hypothetical protein
VPQAIPQATPQAVPQIAAIPQAVPNPVPQAIPQATPSLIPRPKPIATPVLAPNKAPTVQPQAKPVLVPSQSTTTPQIAHVQEPRTPAIGRTQITNVAGRQAAHATPRFRAEDGGKAWHCVASGHGQRRSVVDGRVEVSGALRHVGSVDVLGRDLPALHPRHSSCVISIRRRK